MSKRTPVTEVVKDAVTFQRERLGEPRPIDPDAFDRWLAQVKAEALREAARLAPFPIDPYGGFDGASLSAARTQITHWLHDRADEIERDQQ